VKASSDAIVTAIQGMGLNVACGAEAQLFALDQIAENPDKN
jgi:hypothetical protein